MICCFSEGVECRTVRDETCSDILRGVVGSASGLAPSLAVAAVAAVAALVALLSIELQVEEHGKCLEEKKKKKMWIEGT